MCLGLSGDLLEPLKAQTVTLYHNRTGKRKKIEPATDGRANSLADAERAAASEIAITTAALQNPLSTGPDNATILKCRLYSHDRVAMLHNDKDEKVCILPKGYEELGGVIKYRGKSEQGFVSKHDLTISPNGLTALLSVLADKKIPPNETLKIAVFLTHISMSMSVVQVPGSCTSRGVLSVETLIHSCAGTRVGRLEAVSRSHLDHGKDVHHRGLCHGLVQNSAPARDSRRPARYACACVFKRRIAC